MHLRDSIRPAYIPSQQIGAIGLWIAISFLKINNDNRGFFYI